MNDSVAITYSGQQVSVPKEVADFLEQDRKREQAQDKRDQRHLSKSEFETVLFCSDCVRRPVEDAVLWNLQLETLREAVDTVVADMARARVTSTLEKMPGIRLALGKAGGRKSSVMNSQKASPLAASTMGLNSVR